MNKLAIVIPAYKSEYFELALNSLASQTNKNFSVYVGDDCSPENLKSICDQFAEDLNIQYHRFENNIGAKNLVDQWERCIDLCNEEEWIWLFSDDDIAEDSCVENFYNTILNVGTNFDVLRFNTNVIDQNGQVLGSAPHGPSFETSAEMAYHLFLGLRGNSMPDHIFSRRIFKTTGGFVKTLYAQGADWATSIKFSKQRGMYIIPHSILSWRYSGLNISSIASKNKLEMVKGHFQFVQWVSNHFKYLNDGNHSVSYQQIMNANLEKLKQVMVHHYGGLSISMIPALIKLLKADFKMKSLAMFKYIYLIYKLSNKRTS